MLTRVEAEHRRVPLDHEGLIADGSSAQKNLHPDRVAPGGHVALELIAREGRLPLPGSGVDLKGEAFRFVFHAASSLEVVQKTLKGEQRNRHRRALRRAELIRRQRHRPLCAVRIQPRQVSSGERVGVLPHTLAVADRSRRRVRRGRES